MLISFLKTFLAWLIALGLYLLIRFYGSDATTFWADSTEKLVIVWLASGLVFALMDRTTETICASRTLRRRTYMAHLVMRVIGMTVGILFVLALVQLVTAASGSMNWSDAPSFFFQNLGEKKNLIGLIYVLIVSGLFGFGRQMRAMVGGRVLRNLMIGRYHKPRKEQRVFMFLDLRDSTTHAENLGHERFSHLIQDCFEDLTESALKHDVEIYQYVGDEAILTWTPEDAACNANCLLAFLDFGDTLNHRSDHYQTNYGLVPRFKAGVNCGEVTVIEVGVLKKEISYLSDVLNTAARLEGKCNELGKTLLISEPVFKLTGEVPGLLIDPIGSIALRGKNQEVQILSVDRVQA